MLTELNKYKQAHPEMDISSTLDTELKAIFDLSTMQGPYFSLRREEGRYVVTNAAEKADDLYFHSARPTQTPDVLKKWAKKRLLLTS